MQHHELKTWPEPFEAVWQGMKSHEVRDNRDRNFVVGDILHLREWSPNGRGYTGREMYATCTYKTAGGGWGLPMSVDVLSIRVDARISESAAREPGKVAP